MEKLRLIVCDLHRNLVPALERGPPAHEVTPRSVARVHEPLPRVRARIWLENPIALLYSPLPALRTPTAPQKSFGGRRPPLLAGGTVPLVTPGTLPAPLPLALPSWARGLLFAPLT